jgi:serine/threonine protein kinase
MSAAPEQRRAGAKTPRVVADRYQLDAELARGGMGAVYAATDLKLDRKVAVKILIAWEHPDAFGRFEREAKVLARLRSDYVVQIHDYGIDQDVPYMVMELLEGESLSTLLKRRERLSVEECLHILLQVARGLEAAHDAGLIHRDLKPSNIFLAKHAEGTIVKLLDFGMVKDSEAWQSADSTASGILLGTPQYMSPEQARGLRNIDHRADLWSLGVILLRVLTGANPFATESIGDAVIRICIDPIPRASELFDLPLELDEFFVKALAREPADRYKDAVDLAQAFSTACGFGELDLSYDGSVMRKGLLPTLEPRDSSPGREPSVRSRRELATGSTHSGASVTSLGTSRSATVGGTQVSSIMLDPRRRRPFVLAAGATAMALGGLLAYLWLGPDARPTGGKAGAAEVAPPAPGPPAATSRVQGPATLEASTSAPSTASASASLVAVGDAGARPLPAAPSSATARASAPQLASAAPTTTAEASAAALPPGHLAKPGRYEPGAL